MKAFTTILLLFGALSALGADNYIIPGARQEGAQTAVVAGATTTGTTAFGNPIVELKVRVSGTGATTVSGTSAVLASGVARTLLISTVTTSGTLASGVKSLDVLVLSGTLGLVATGTTNIVVGQTYSLSVAPDTLPALPYVVSASGTAQIITTR